MNQKWYKNKKLTPYLFISPAVLLIFGFLFYPMFNIFSYSLWRYNVNKPYATKFIGLDNFIEIFTRDNVFYGTLGLTAAWVLIQVTIQLVFGMMIALLLNQNFKGRGIVRSFVFLPWSISGVLTSVLWSLIYNEHIGVLNDICLKLGLIDNSVAWLGNASFAFLSIVVADFWRAVPFFAITLLAAMQSIPMELYESCRIDGGSKINGFRYVTLPFLKNNIVLTTLLTCVWEFKNVDLIYNLTGGGPGYLSTTLSIYITNTSINNRDFGYGSALAVVAFFFLLIASVIYLRLTKFGKEENDV